MSLRIPIPNLAVLLRAVRQITAHPGTWAPHDWCPLTQARTARSYLGWALHLTGYPVLVADEDWAVLLNRCNAQDVLGLTTEETMNLYR